MASAISSNSSGRQSTSYEEWIKTITLDSVQLTVMLAAFNYEKALPISESLLVNLRRVYRVLHKSALFSELPIQFIAGETLLGLVSELQSTPPSERKISEITLIRKLIISVRAAQSFIYAQRKERDILLDQPRMIEEFGKLLQQAQGEFSPREDDLLSEYLDLLEALEEDQLKPYLNLIREKGIPIEYVRKYSILFVALQGAVYCWRFAFQLRASSALEKLNEKGRIELPEMPKEVLELIVDYIHLAENNLKRYSMEHLSIAFSYAFEWKFVPLQQKIEEEIWKRKKEVVKQPGLN